VSEESGGGNGLGRSLGLFTATAIVVANMIGSGIFTTSGIMASQLPGSGWVIMCWLLGGLIAISGALCYAELATRMPQAGGEYVYLKRLYHPTLGFLTGWTSFFVGFSAPIALSAFGFTEYMFTSLGNRYALNEGLELTLAKKGFAILLILVFTGLHYIGTRLGAKVQNALTVLKIALILGLAGAGMMFGNGGLGGMTFKLDGPVAGMAFGAAMMMVMFSYSGWNASAYIASELKRPRITLPVSLVAGTAIVIVIYLAINLFIFHSTPYAALQGKVAVVEVASVWAFGNWLADLLGGLIGVAMLSSLGAFIMIGPRIYYAMARDGLFFPFAGEVHPNYGVPSRAIAVQGGLAVMMVAVGSFEQLLVYVGFALGIFPLLAIAGLFIARHERIGEETAVKVWAYPLVPLFFILSSIALMTFAYFERPLESTAAVLSVLLGVPCYFLWVKGIRARMKAEAE
jgi:APA family basic amino acid/polyamine antiporter